MCGGTVGMRCPTGMREEMMQERGIDVDHSTINRWVLKYSPELDKRLRPHLRPSNAKNHVLVTNRAMFALAIAVADELHQGSVFVSTCHLIF